MYAYMIHEYISDKLKVSLSSNSDGRCEYHVCLGEKPDDDYDDTLTHIRSFLKMLKSLDPECERLYNWFNYTESISEDRLEWDLFIDFNSDLGDRIDVVFIETLFSKMVVLAKRGSWNPKANALTNKQMEDFYKHLRKSI